MEKQNRPNWKREFLFIAFAAAVLMFAATSQISAQTYKAGDRVECEVTGNPKDKWWMKGTIQPFKDGDFGAGVEPDGSWYRFKADANKVEYPCKPEVLRPIAGTETKPTNKNETKPQSEENKTEAENEMPGGNFVECPIEQKPVKNGARPDVELVKKIIRCKKGEKSVEEGDEGAVKVEISSVQIGAPRPWSYSQDSGNAKPGTVVYPVKATYTVKTFYRNATEVEEGWIRVLNFYVNAFGEWQIGSEETIKAGKSKRIPK